MVHFKELNENDVVCENDHEQWPGNAHYYDLINVNAGSYKHSELKSVVERIIDAIHNRGGRFVRQSRTINGYWVEVMDDKFVRNKIVRSLLRQEQTSDRRKRSLLQQEQTSDRRKKKKKTKKKLDLSLLSPDCQGRIFQFLPLCDCFRFAETSKKNLAHMILELDKRRYDQLLTPPLTMMNPRTISDLMTWVRWSELDETRDRVFPQQPQEEKRHWHRLESVAVRIKLLHPTIPRSHPSYGILTNLVADLEKTTMVEKSDWRDASLLLHQWSCVTNAHRLHAMLLSRSTVRLHLDPIEDKDHRFTVSLERYVGDVLLAACLGGHSYREIKPVVEGGPSFHQWGNHLLSPCPPIDTDDEYLGKRKSAKDWYQYWVFAHSSLLQVAPSKRAQIRFGPAFDQQNQSFVIPPRTYSGFELYCMKSMTKMLRMTQDISERDERIGYLEAILYEGPFGRRRGPVMSPVYFFLLIGYQSLVSIAKNLHRYRCKYSRILYSLNLGINEHYASLVDERVPSPEETVAWMEELQKKSDMESLVPVQNQFISIRMMTRDEREGLRVMNMFDDIAL